MKKVGIITILKCNNYGADLQAYALQHKLSLLGYDAEIIDYLFYKNNNYIAETCSRPILKLSIINRIKERLYPLLTHIKSFRFYSMQKERSEKFDKFYEKHMKTTCCYNSYSVLYNANMDYDVYCVGSDQVWNPYTNTSLNPYFLTFAPKNKRKISYASSFGVSKLPSQYIAYYKQMLSNFDFISVRESTGVSIVKKLGFRAENVLDPTLLLNNEDWDEIASYDKVPDFPYLLLYTLSSSPYITQLAKKISEQRGWRILRICKNAIKEDRDSTIINILDADPFEFLGLFSKATFVLTNSFHGTAFSINYQKPFYSVLRKGKINNSRLHDLLSLLQLENRLLIENDNLSFKDIDLDYCMVNKLLEKERLKSIGYLNNAINS